MATSDKPERGEAVDKLERIRIEKLERVRVDKLERVVPEFKRATLDDEAGDAGPGDTDDVSKPRDRQQTEG
jgi:hypothetical protein